MCGLDPEEEVGFGDFGTVFSSKEFLLSLLFNFFSFHFFWEKFILKKKKKKKKTGGPLLLMELSFLLRKVGAEVVWITN